MHRIVLSPGTFHTTIAPRLICRTSQFVDLLSTVIWRLPDDHGQYLNKERGESLVEYLVRSVREAEADLADGTRLLMIQIVMFTEDELRGKIKIQVLAYGHGGGTIFNSHDDALRKHLRSCLGCDDRYSEQNTVELIASLVVDCAATSRGQLTHPTQLLDHLDSLANLCKAISDDQLPMFLKHLTAACLKAERAGACFAAVAIEDVVNEAFGLDVRFEPFCAADEATLRAEQLRRRGIATVVSQRVVVQEIA